METILWMALVGVWLVVGLLVGILMLKHKRSDQNADAVDGASGSSRSTKDDGS